MLDCLTDFDLCWVAAGVAGGVVQDVELASPVFVAGAAGPVPDVGMPASQREANLFAGSTDTNWWNYIR